MGEEELFELVERLLASGGPIPSVILFGKIEQGGAIVE